MTASIKFPCGCEINETHVVAMCIPHDVELRQMRNEQEKRAREMWRPILETIDKHMRRR